MPDTNIYRISQLEKCYTEVDTKLDKIMENHLPHIEIELISMKTRITILTTINIGAIVMGLILQELFK